MVQHQQIQNAALLIVRAAGTYTYHSALKGTGTGLESKKEMSMFRRMQLG
jgi:hypothetical protein